MLSSQTKDAVVGSTMRHENALPTKSAILDQSGVHSCEKSNAIALLDINLELRRNSLTCIIGTVGSGKVCEVVLQENVNLLSISL